MIKVFIFYFFSCIFLFSYADEYGSSTGYKLPRFVSLKSDEVNMRVGSSKNYPIILQYTIKNLPVEIIDEYDSWRKINDIDGNKGWIHKALLKGERYAIVKKSHDSNIKIYSSPKGKAIGEIGEKNIIKVDTCLLDWCKIEYDKYKGWIKKSNLWGVYDSEKINVSFFQPLINLIWKINFKLPIFFKFM